MIIYDVGTIQVCAVGWEPNPRMTNYLKRLEKSFQRCGHRVTIFTETGVGTREDSLHFAAIQHVSPYWLDTLPGAQ